MENGEILKQHVILSVSEESHNHCEILRALPSE